MLRVANLALHSLKRKLPLAFNSGTKGIGSSAPNGGLGLAMGLSGADGTLTLCIGAEGGDRIITAYGYSEMVFQETGNGWVKIGANSSFSQKTFNPRAMDTLVIWENAPFFLVSDTAIEDAWVDAPAHPRGT